MEKEKELNSDWKNLYSSSFFDSPFTVHRYHDSQINIISKNLIISAALIIYAQH